jgi:alginate O-acetyltransferase complex protein AlgJ
MRRRFLQRSPIYGVAGFIAVMFLASLWNYAVERNHPKLRIRSAHPLFGVALTPPAPLTFDALLSGETQKAISINLGRSLPIFPITVRAKNQFLFSLFGASGAANIVIGKNDQLYEKPYIDEFCGRNGATDASRIDKWADQVREIATTLEGQGKKFVYLISPSKAAQYPQYLPAGLACRGLVNGAKDKLAPYRAALDARHIRYVDGAGLMGAEQHNYSIDFFPRGGTHWNLLGAALSVREMSRVLEDSPFGAFDFDWREAPEALGTDRDLLDLLNLLWPDPRYPTAIIERRGAVGNCERAPRALALGGSFLQEINSVLTQAPCPPEIDYWFYMRTITNDYELVRFHKLAGDVSNGERLRGGVDELRANVARADIVVLEENEGIISLTRQIGDLRNALTAGASAHN